MDQILESNFLILDSFVTAYLGHGDNGWKYVPRIIQSLAGQGAEDCLE